MNTDWQTWAALIVVAAAAVLLARNAWRGRNRHDGCGCPGATNSRELSKLKKRIARNPRARSLL
ncbi:MAG: hypothetical protein ACREIA_04310 [Opitutaceae bacterium]